MALPARPASAATMTGPDPRMHIVFVLPIGEYYSQEWTGAIATVTRHLARELGAEGHRVTVLTPDDGGTSFAEGDVERLPHGSAHPTPTLLRKANSATARLRRWTWPDYGPYLRAVERRLRSLEGPVDAVVVANDPGTADRLARGGFARRTLLWLHNRLEGAEARPFATMASSVGVVAVSQAVADWTRERYLPHADIRVIHSGVDHDLFHPRRDWLGVRDPVRVVCHGRIDPNKGHEVAASAVARLRAAGLPVELTVIGEVRTFGFSQAEADDYGRRLAAAVHGADGTLLGWMPHAELAEQLRTNDVACVLSRVDEPFGLVTLEAMASGCAIIATRKGGIPEAVGSGGALVEPESPDEVADILEAWVRDREQLNSMKRAAVERAAGFTWSATAAALIRLLS
jgi:glycosyltransferase involved in cell wall biosynthesis